MKRLTIRSGETRLVWLLLVTASAIALTNYLGDPNSERMTGEMCFGLFAAAWVSVVLAWRWHRPHLRRWSGGLTFLVVVGEIITVSAVRSSLFACPVPPPTPQERQYHALTAATLRHDLAGVQAILAHDDPDRVVCARGVGCSPMETPLSLAVATNDVPIAAALIERGADVSHTPSLLDQAAGQNNVAMMRLLIHHGARVNDSATDGGNSIIWEAVLQGNTEATDCLLQAGANPRIYGVGPILYDKNGMSRETRWSLLHLARYKEHIPIAKLLIKAGAPE